MKAPFGYQRKKMVRIRANVLQEWLTTGYQANFAVVEGLPKDAVLTDTFYFDGQLHLRFQHPSFPETPIGALLPDLPIVFKTAPSELFCDLWHRWRDSVDLNE